MEDSSDYEFNFELKTFGEDVIGRREHPDSDVEQVQKLCVDIINILRRRFEKKESIEYITGLIFESAVKLVLEASMMSTKFLTMKDSDNQKLDS